MQKPIEAEMSTKTENDLNFNTNSSHHCSFHFVQLVEGVRKMNSEKRSHHEFPFS